MTKTTVSRRSPELRQMSLETANEMFKASFVVKKMRFAEKFPDLSDIKLDRITAQYFRELAEKSEAAK